MYAPPLTPDSESALTGPVVSILTSSVWTADALPATSVA